MKPSKSLISESYDGGNEFNHLEQAIFAADELNGALTSLIDMNESKFSKYGDVVKKLRRLCNELPPMLETLKREIKKENEKGDSDDFDFDDDSDDDEESDKDEGDENGTGAELEDSDDDELEDIDIGESFVRKSRGRRLNEEFCLKEEGTASSFEDKTWQCEDFWDKVHEQGLEDELDRYFEESYPDGMDLTEFNDLLRFDGDDVLAAIGYANASDEESDDDYNSHIGFNRLGV
jgi:hypothetical protein